MPWGVAVQVGVFCLEGVCCDGCVPYFFDSLMLCLVGGGPVVGLLLVGWGVLSFTFFET